MTARNLRIGVDVGGTNTDGVILDPTLSTSPSRGILAWNKSSTTPNPSDGINACLHSMFSASKVNPEHVASVTIGTTHFINAVIEQDSSRLAKVAVLRLCGPFAKGVPPCVDWPLKLRSLICAYHARISGGLEVDGSLIGDINEEQIREQAEIIKSKGIKSVVIIGVFSPVDIHFHQEQRAAEIFRTAYEDVDIVLSKDVANLGFLERENAAVLNASILPFARRTISSFQQAISKLGLRCPVFITQNDGTILLAREAAKLPIRTFSSGPTNSMRGAAFLTQSDNGGGKGGEAMMVVDIGGTTTDVGLLLPNGFPRQAAAFSEISGVRTNFSYPDVRSIGLGGGSIVRKQADGKLRVGPDSVGYQLTEKAVVFGGEVVTATDYTVLGDEKLEIGDWELVVKKGLEGTLGEFKSLVKKMLERAIDTMKTSAEDIPVLLVGGGAVIAPDVLEGASRVVKPEWSGVANAIGAATARVSGVVDTVESTEVKSAAQVMKEISERAVQKAVRNGAREDTVSVVEMDHLPLQYIANKSRFIVKAVGDFDFSREAEAEVLLVPENQTEVDQMEDFAKKSSLDDASSTSNSKPEVEIDIMTYKPEIRGREWIISNTDLDWISCGCYILGTGGGGSPYGHMLRLREIMKEGGVVRVISPDDLRDEDLVACGGGKGSPTVSMEKLTGDEMMQAQLELYKYMNVKPDAMIALEIGGGNGLQGMILGASTNMNIPTVDGDWMGRAYPVAWQTTPVVFEEKPVFLPSTICDGNGNVMFMTQAKSELMVERAFRAALSQMGSHVGCAKGPISGKNTKSWVVEHTISLSWRIGRAVALSRAQNKIDSVAESIIKEVGGGESGRVLFKGKIVGVERTLRMGHVYGEVIIESTNELVEGMRKEKLKIPFKNENIVAIKVEDDGSDTILASVPDLICVIDAQNGEAIGTPEYRYGLLVLVLGIVASEKWTSTPRGLEIGGPKGFGMDHIEWKSLGKFQKPTSVIDEYGVARS
ncbi:hypothetical protein B0J14DRAFT_575297 [Halenospora varia]|nr:hypothetical protein B0J14DRAFT_575297 [Halenospora varia]